MCLWPQSLDRSHHWRIKCLWARDSHTRRSAQRLIPCMMMLPFRIRTGSKLCPTLRCTEPELTSTEVIMWHFRQKLRLHQLIKSLHACDIIICNVFGSFTGFLPFKMMCEPSPPLSLASVLHKGSGIHIPTGHVRFNETPADLQRWERLFFMKRERAKEKGGERLRTRLKLLFFFFDVKSPWARRRKK